MKNEKCRQYLVGRQNWIEGENKGKNMSIVIDGGNECMTCQYESICKGYGCKAKCFPKEKGMLKKKIGKPDLIVLFIGTVSHKMMLSATQEAKKNGVPVARIQSSSATALHNALKEYCL